MKKDEEKEIKVKVANPERIPEAINRLYDFIWKWYQEKLEQKGDQD